MSGDKLANEIVRKRPVWLALSEFWLDTELQSEDLKRIAVVLKVSGYDPNDIERIYKFEVAPVVLRNIFPFSPNCR